MNKSDICFIRAKLKDDYVYDGIRKAGFDIHIPYTDFNLSLRIMREIWFRLHLPRPDLWYNKELKSVNAEVFIIKDPLMTTGLIDWVHKNHPNKRIILMYENRAYNTINPDTIPEYVEKWHYDEDDCKQYSMKMEHANYFDIYRFEPNNQDTEYDVLYLGRDKGRLQQILQYRELFENKGLSTYFHICADRSFLTFKNSEYKPLISYNKYLELLKKSKAILNIVPQGQKSVTQREMEAVFDQKKCITNNLGILDFELYDPSRYFLIGKDDMNNLHDFIYSDFKSVEEKKLEEYRFETAVQEVVEG